MPLGITMPGAWSGGNLTFQISTDGALYNDLHEANGDEVTMVGLRHIKTGGMSGPPA